MLSKLKAKMFAGESGDVIKGMLTLLIGLGLARIVGLISIPILARIYSPTDYGVLALYISFIAILSPLMTLRFVQAIPLPRNEGLAFNLFILCFKIIGLFSIVIAFMLALFGQSILAFFNMEALMPWRWLIVLGAAGTAIFELFSLWATRKKQYKTLAKTQLTQSLIGNFAKIGLGLLAFKPGGMIVGQFLSQSAGLANFIKDARKDIKKYLPRVKWHKQKILAKYYQDFFWFRLPSQLLMVLSLQAPVMMMAALYDKEVTGQLSMAMMALSLPIGLIGGAVAKAFYAEIADLGKKNIGKIIKLTFSVQRKLFFVGIPFALLVYFLSEIAFKTIFGTEWILAGHFASVLAPFVLFQFTSSPLMEVINILGKQIIYLFLHGFRILGLIGIYFFTEHNELLVNQFVITISLYLSFFYISASLIVLFLLVKSNAKAQ